MSLRIIVASALSFHEWHLALRGWSIAEIAGSTNPRHDACARVASDARDARKRSQAASIMARQKFALFHRRRFESRIKLKAGHTISVEQLRPYRSCSMACTLRERSISLINAT